MHRHDLPTPSASELAQHRADLERLRQMREAQREADAEWERRMRGRHVSVGGHDGRVMYARFTRPHYEHIYRIPLPERATARTWRFLRVAEQLGADPTRIVGWEI